MLGFARTRSLATFAALALLASASRSEASLPSERGTPIGGPRAARLGVGDPLPAGIRTALIRAIQDGAPSAWDLAPSSDRRWIAREDGARFELGAEGVELVVTGARARLRTVSIGRPGARRVVGESALRVERNVAALDHGAGAVERWVHGPLGMEQLYEVSARPAGEGPLEIELALEGDLTPRAAGIAVELVDAEGRARGEYGELWVEDARHARVPARLALDGARLRLVVDDRDALYPLMIDPLVFLEQARLEGTMAGDFFGFSVAVSGDTVLVGTFEGDPVAPRGPGSAYVFVRTGEGWTLEARLEPTTAHDGAAFGFAVALWGDSAVVGARFEPLTRFQNGVVYAYEREGSTWTRTDRLTPPIDLSYFGKALALEEDTLVAAGLETVYVYARSPGGWAVEARPSAARMRVQGIALSGDTLAVGAPMDGEVHVMTRDGGEWTTQQILRGPDQYGASVALHEDTLLVGSPWERERAGVVRAYRRSGSAWAEEGVLVGADTEYGDDFATSVALRGDTAVVGARTRSGTEGAAYVFSRTGSSWSQQTILTPAEPRVNAWFGEGLALSSDTLVVGAITTGGAPGSAYVFSARATQGSSCSAASQCESGHCVEGVCCDTACGGGADDDCQACSRAAGAAVDGTCGAVSAGTECRAAAGACDVAEVCDGTGLLCPDDAPPGCDDPDAGAPAPDAGAPAPDAGAPAPDAGHGTTTAGGCGCRAGAQNSGAGMWLSLALAVALVVARRRRW